MYHIKEKTVYELEVKKSRFIAVLLPVQDESEAKELLSAVKKAYPNATHYCTAMIVGNIQRSNDDGEPSGTAGLPMLECLRHHDLHNVLAVVVRYFGGTLLGTGGLVKAYQSAVNGAIDKATLTQPTLMHQYTVKVPYDMNNKVEQLLRNNAIITQTDYQEDITYEFLCEEDLTPQFLAISSGQLVPEFQQDIIYEKDIKTQS